MHTYTFYLSYSVRAPFKREPQQDEAQIDIDAPNVRIALATLASKAGDVSNVRVCGFLRNQWLSNARQCAVVDRHYPR